eukprot:1123915-Pelagomonas_calceolata.AAC.1
MAAEKYEATSTSTYGKVCTLKPRLSPWMTAGKAGCMEKLRMCYAPDGTPYSTESLLTLFFIQTVWLVSVSTEGAAITETPLMAA